MILGIDTSCYTTSIALCDQFGRLLCDKRRLLSVAQGQCGLRQSEAVFEHTRNLPSLMEAAMAKTEEKLTAVCFSARPRPRDDSYMPVFLAGCAVARSVAAVCHIPCYETSHQEGHLEAALSSAGLEWQGPFIALHLSGGTGEILWVQPQAIGFDVSMIDSADLPPGQFVDRVGVALGLPFPAGPELEKLAAQARGTDFRLTGSVRGTHISFSGPESAAQRAITAGVDAAEIAVAVLDNIAKSIEKAIIAARQKYDCERVLLAGGVAANQRIRDRLRRLDVRFAGAGMSGDNAVGVARLGWKKYCVEQGE